ncbi:hypothetical protein PCASD_22534 [Puccinia coronata f. sp. avenae]|uniref:Uncharacterized protein n=1 Tax=Puccinia coronata f. sp. avenae TaxID=200324 RepID=A0A2N5TI28_9BASI|nr:hypothetical protein PCASD_22534 [Puccinia coronata f. sp. avenae]
MSEAPDQNIQVVLGLRKASSGHGRLLDHDGGPRGFCVLGRHSRSAALPAPFCAQVRTVMAVVGRVSGWFDQRWPGWLSGCAAACIFRIAKCSPEVFCWGSSEGPDVWSDGPDAPLPDARSEGPEACWEEQTLSQKEQTGVWKS